MLLKFAKHERVWLRDLPEFSEAWLHDRICDDTACLGLGEVGVLARERVQYSGGRLDILLLADTENEIRYGVEIMLGATDPSHIIRCIEYWDIERRRYPAYEHVAVLIAEEVTSRFLNVMSLLAGTIPFVAIQLNALKVGDQVILSFVKVLDQRALREDETLETGGEAADRGTWEARAGGEMMKLCDRVAEIANEVAEPRLELKYQQSRVRVCPPGSFFNVATLWPKKSLLALRVGVGDAARWVTRFEEAGMQADARKEGTVRLRPGELSQNEPILRETLHQAVREFQAG